MNNFKSYLIPTVAGMIVAGFSSWSLLAASRSGTDNAPVGNSPELSSPVTTNPSPTPSIIDQSDSSPVSVTQNPANTISLTIYRPDSQCDTLVPEKVEVSAASPVTAAVGKVLEQNSSSDFDLAGYRVNLNPNNRVATIDFRLSPDTRRQFVSLSTCEQFALFGSLRKTLTDNSQFNIKDVRFTQQGEEIYL